MADSLAKGLASLNAEDLAKLRRFVAAHNAAKESSHSDNYFQSRILYVGLFSRSATLSNNLSSLLDGVVQMSLRINADGTHYAFINFQSALKAEVGKRKLEDMKKRMLEANDHSLFDCDTVFNYRDANRTPNTSSEPTGIYVEQLGDTVTQGDLVRLGVDKLGHCGFIGAVRREPSAGLNYAIFNFSSHRGAVEAKAKLLQLKVEESKLMSSKPFFSPFSRIDFAVRAKDK